MNNIEKINNKTKRYNTHIQSRNTVNICKYHQFNNLWLITANCLESQGNQTVVLSSVSPKLLTPQLQLLIFSSNSEKEILQCC